MVKYDAHLIQQHAWLPTATRRHDTAETEDTSKSPSHLPMMRRVIAARLRSHRKYLQPGCDAAINALPPGARGSGVFHANSGSRIYMRGGCLLSILPNPSKKPSVTVNGTRDLYVLLFGYSMHEQWEIPTASPVNRYRRPLRKTERRC